jgi:2,3-bisphosphoglycerate-dependent phosphoglycerate mutase
MNKARRIVFLRHGQSEYNLSNRFTGWQDIRLTQHGIEQAKNAGKVLREHGFNQFDIAYTSYLKRAIWTYHTVAEELDLHWIRHLKDWRINEKHYGALEGHNKYHSDSEVQEELTRIRNSYDIPPPLLRLDDSRHPIH